MAALSAKQNAFVAQYLVDLDATKAAIRAGYSEKTAASIGAENLRKPQIKQAVAEAIARRSARVEVKQDDVLRELIRIFAADIGLAYDENGKLKKLHDMPEDIRRCIVGVKVKELFEGHGEEREYIGDLVEVKFADKVKAIEMAMKHLGLLVDRVEHSADESFAQALKEARARVAKRE